MSLGLRGERGRTAEAELVIYAGGWADVMLYGLGDEDVAMEYVELESAEEVGLWLTVPCCASPARRSGVVAMGNDEPQRFQRWHFEPRYGVEIDPEFPGDGDWRCRVLGFARTGQVQEPFESRWGTPTVVRVEPTANGPWIGMFASGGLGGVSVVSACPNAEQLCVAAEGLAYIVDVSAPGGVIALHDQVTQVVAVEAEALVLLVSFTGMLAVGATGVEWRTRRIALDGLRVIAASRTEIVASCDSFEGTAMMTLDPHSGQQTGGLRFESFWPPDALA